MSSPESKLFSSSLEQESTEKSEQSPWQMTFEEFSREYERIMQAVASKEKKGRLDPDSQPYEPLSQEERELLNGDWKAFSRRRGFSEEDIFEYERWLVLSGQQDKLEGAINDPWRRNRKDWEKHLYKKHIELAQKQGRDIPTAILKDYKELLQEEQGKKIDKEAPIPSAAENKSNEEVW